MIELRKSERHRVLKGGRIVFNGGRSTVNCVMRNVSKGGAQLNVPSLVGVPENFLLKMSDRTSHNCTVAWRRPEAIGVQFH
jgi:PilZ domain